MVSAIFATSFLGQENAGDLVKKKIVDVMDSKERRCHPPCGCCLSIPGFREIEDSAFYSIALFYEKLFEIVKNKSWYIRDYDEFIKIYASRIEDKSFFLDNSPIKKYESNVRRHFNMMIKAHFDIISDAINKIAASLEDKNGKSELGNAITKVRMDLVMHSMNYWEKEKYKEDIDA
jgi:hypothetical protein